MLLAGLTGGLACGKTFISEELERLGCRVIHADRLGHEVLAPGGAAYQAVVDLFGPGILDCDGAIDRAHLAELVFNDADKLTALNAIIHPAVRRREEALVEEIAATDPDAIVVVEAAILIEAGAFDRFDYLIVAECSEAQQFERASARNPSIPEANIRARLRSQMPSEEKRTYADFLIDTSGERENTLRQAQEIFAILRQNRKKPK